jgi:SDR family mycofactocin-dependent oxidoreductase
MGDRLVGKVVLITGVARGQGREHAIRFAEEGADIIGVDICADLPNMPYSLATQDDLAEVVAQVERLDRRMVASVVDVVDRNALTLAVDAGVAQLGRLDIVVANAGICPLGSYPPETFQQVVDVDLIGVMNTVSASYRHLSDGASIIATGSVAGILPGGTDNPVLGPGGLGYSFAKRSIARYVHDLALVLAPRRIRVNGLHPTNVDTELLHNQAMYRVFRPDLENPTREDAEPALAMMQAMPIPSVTPRDVSNAALFLASDESRFVTGTNLRVDGGAVIKQLPDAL